MRQLAGLILLGWGVCCATILPLGLMYGRAWNPTIPAMAPLLVALGSLVVAIAGLWTIADSRWGFRVGLAVSAAATLITANWLRSDPDVLAIALFFLPPFTVLLLLISNALSRRRAESP